MASYYHDSLAGRLTANGERYNPAAATCAHRTHPMGTRVSVTVLSSGRRAECRVNDRGPYAKGRILDVSSSLADRLGFRRQGVARVRLVVTHVPPASSRRRITMASAFQTPAPPPPDRLD